jgi:predicted secreted protein
MKNSVLSSLLFVAVLLFTTNSFAGDYATLNVIGFSKDGRYLAFEEYGAQDGSGFPYSNIFFIDTAKNMYAAARVAVVIEKETASESAARRRAAMLSAKKLKQLGIVKGNTGKLVVSHLITDFTFADADKPAPNVKFAEEVGSMYRRGDFELSLKQIPVKTKDCVDFEDDTKMLELKLTNIDDDSSKFLQKDATLPSGRGCALDYRIQDVYLYKDVIAVFVGFLTRGFEGPDMRFMAISGKLR